MVKIETKLPNEKKSRKSGKSMVTAEDNQHIMVNTGRLIAFIPKDGKNIIDSLCLDGKKIGGAAKLIATTNNANFCSKLTKVVTECKNAVSTVIKLEGTHVSPTHRGCLSRSVCISMRAVSRFAWCIPSSTMARLKKI